jgi:hypothetical protein
VIWCGVCGVCCVVLVPVLFCGMQCCGMVWCVFRYRRDAPDHSSYPALQNLKVLFKSATQIAPEADDTERWPERIGFGKATKPSVAAVPEPSAAGSAGDDGDDERNDDKDATGIENVSDTDDDPVVVGDDDEDNSENDAKSIPSSPENLRLRPAAAPVPKSPVPKSPAAGGLKKKPAAVSPTAPSDVAAVVNAAKDCTHTTSAGTCQTITIGADLHALLHRIPPGNPQCMVCHRRLFSRPGMALDC